MAERDSKGRFVKGNTPWLKGRKHTEKAKIKMSESQKGLKLGDKNPMWKGGKYSCKGYTLTKFGDKYSRLNRLVMSKHLGRELSKEEVVHHIDFDKSNNELSNLHLFENQSNHMDYHKFLKDIVRDNIYK